jgi:hypothetical protein
MVYQLHADAKHYLISYHILARVKLKILYKNQTAPNMRFFAIVPEIKEKTAFRRIWVGLEKNTHIDRNRPNRLPICGAVVSPICHK